ncbi:BQ5605_C003g02322 [Microbotryum silenes-dioicae]|uniref:BQ5605_C003g02322 protein n=1 Tax=Microbotryum silenes-dioicae TaxID=796604 RepID=A0A2X0M5M2_9BASI|nr:BQ5605_C003g02322 [Microbotryum silenes-dioicae]
MFRQRIRQTARVAGRGFTSSSLQHHSIKTLGVIGAGQMGLGIALTAARVARVEVLLADSNRANLDKSLAFAESLLQKDVTRGKLDAETSSAILAKIKLVDGIAAFDKVDIVIEAVSEDLSLKEKIFAELAQTTPTHAILASNTSSISLTKIAAAAGSRAAQTVGFHFFNPVPVMKLVELIPAIQTSPETLAEARSFAEAMGKTVSVSKDSPGESSRVLLNGRVRPAQTNVSWLWICAGFISNALLMPYINEAVTLLSKGIATREDIDQVMVLGMAHKMGPLVLADFIGLDTCLSIMQVLHTETGDSKYRPSVLLGRMVSAGYLGKKSGKGFYEY